VVVLRRVKGKILGEASRPKPVSMEMGQEGKRRDEQTKRNRRESGDKTRPTRTGKR